MHLAHLIYWGQLNRIGHNSTHFIFLVVTVNYFHHAATIFMQAKLDWVEYFLVPDNYNLCLGYFHAISKSANVHNL